MSSRSRSIPALIVVALLAVARLPAQAAVESVGIEQLGLPGDRVAYGARPELSFYLPVYRSVRSIRFIATLRVSPAVDPRSTITVSSGGVPQFSETVEALHRNPRIDVAIPLPRAPQRIADVSVAGAFTHIGDDVCSRYDPDSLYLIIDRSSGFALTTGPASPTIAGFLENYGGDVAIVVPDGSSLQRKLAAVRLAYVVEQLYRWRHAKAILRSTPDPNARNVVLGDFKTDLSVDGNRLDVSANGVALIDREIDPLLITTAVDSAQLASTALKRSGSRVAIADLGMTTQTIGGTSASFSVPFNIGLLGGLPNGLRMNVALAHTALDAEQRGTVSVTINGQLVDSLPLSKTGGVQSNDFIVPMQLVASANDVRVNVDYDVARDCRISPPNLTTTLFDTTSFGWDGVTPYTFSVGDFFRAAAGKGVVLVDGDASVPYAFSLLATLGLGNTGLTSIDVAPFDGSIPKGYDAAIVVAPLERAGAWSLPLATAGGRFVLGEGAPPLTANFADPFGVLETTRDGDTQTLLASYWKDPQPTVGLANFGFETLASQTGRVFMFRGERDVYASTAPRKRDLSQPFLIRAAIPIGVAFVALILLAILLARRKRSGGTVQ